MTNCQTCGKLIASGTAESMCRACRAEALAEAKAAIAAQEPAPPAEDSGNAPSEPEVVPCVRCRREAAMEHSHFCVGCQLELVNALGDAAEELFRTPPPPPLPLVSSTVSLLHDIDEKRERTATSHIHVVGAAKIK